MVERGVSYRSDDGVCRMCPPMGAWDHVRPFLLLAALTGGLVLAMHALAAAAATALCWRVRLRVDLWNLSLPFAVAALSALQLVAQVALMMPSSDALPPAVAAIK